MVGMSLGKKNPTDFMYVCVYIHIYRGLADSTHTWTKLLVIQKKVHILRGNINRLFSVERKALFEERCFKAEVPFNPLNILLAMSSVKDL